MTSPSPHAPVLLTEVIKALNPQAGETYIDATFGAGGYSSAILDAAPCSVLAIDRDPSVISHTRTLQEKYGARFTFRQGCFSALDKLAHTAGFSHIDGIVMDLGVSSMQLDTPMRGFSFMHDGPLDMRMGDSDKTAADIVNHYDEKQLSHIIAIYGEERRARAIAKAITTARKQAPITQTRTLAILVENIVGNRATQKIHPATRTFQALRIYVNDELGELMRGLHAAETILAPQGRLIVVSFHSLEDRIVKRFFAKRSGRAGRASRHLPQIDPPSPSFVDYKKRSITAGSSEINTNPRARSAHMRAGYRTYAPIFPPDETVSLSMRK